MRVMIGGSTESISENYETDLTVTGGKNFLTITIDKALGTQRQRRLDEISPNLINCYSGSNDTTIMQHDATLLECARQYALSPQHRAIHPLEMMPHQR